MYKLVQRMYANALTKCNIVCPRKTVFIRKPGAKVLAITLIKSLVPEFIRLSALMEIFIALSSSLMERIGC